MKKILIKTLVLLLVFAGSVGLFAWLMDDETIVRTEDMKQATLPLVYMVYKDVEMNPLHGYVQPMEVTTVRDTLTPISTERDLTLKVDTFGAKVTDIYFEVFTADGSRSLENTKVTSISAGEDSLTANFTLQSKIRMNQEYVLKIQLLADGRDVYYYTRIVQQDSLHTKEYLDFVNTFSDKCLNHNADSLAVYLEPEYDVEQNNLSYMDVHTTTDQLEWGNLEPQIYYKSIPAIKELNETTATILQEYTISAADEDGNVELYTVNEYFRLRYADEVVMLLDFERTTTERFNPDNGVLTDNGINLGITSNEISFVSDSQGSYFAFVQGGELWSYCLSDGKMTQVFTFRQKDDSDYRDIYGEHQIRALNVGGSGNIYFIVAGYMNRGRHEGESGVTLYHYDASTGGVEEKLFVNTNRSYDLLKADISELAYVTDDQENFYMLLDGDVYRINLITLEMTTVIEGLKPGCAEGSKSGRRFAYLKENEPYNSSAIVLMDMDTGISSEIVCGESERLRMLGFINESLVYGIADRSDIDASHEGDELFPMKQLLILNENGERVKEYGQAGYYVVGGEITDRLLTIDRVQKGQDGWQEAAQDHIIDNTADETGIGLTTQVTDRKQTEVVLRLGNGVTPETPQVIRSRMIVLDADRNISIPFRASQEEVYYVYAAGQLKGVYEHANTAIVKADEQFGVVVDQNQQYIWERGNRVDIVDLNLSKIPQCILNGTMDLESLAQQLPDKLVLDLAGCSMDEILYFISAGNPVIADTVDGVRVLTGYDQWGNVAYYNPNPSEEEIYEQDYYDEETDTYRTESNKRTAAETYLLDDVDSLELFEESGNIFIGFLDKAKE